MDIIKLLQGKKTYLVAIAIGIVTALKYTGKIDDATYQLLLGLLGAGGMGTMAAKINRG